MISLKFNWNLLESGLHRDQLLLFSHATGAFLPLHILQINGIRKNDGDFLIARRIAAFVLCWLKRANCRYNTTLQCKRFRNFKGHVGQGGNYWLAKYVQVFCSIVIHWAFSRCITRIIVANSETSTACTHCFACSLFPTIKWKEDPERFYKQSSHSEVWGQYSGRVRGSCTKLLRPLVPQWKYTISIRVLILQLWAC